MPIITVFYQDVSSADADIVADITAYILVSYQVPVANQYPGDPNIYALVSYQVPVANQYPGDPTVYILVSYGVPVANQNPSAGDLVGFLAKGNVQTIASDMKINESPTIDLVGFLAKGNVYTVSSNMKVTWKA